MSEPQDPSRRSTRSRPRSDTTAAASAARPTSSSERARTATTAVKDATTAGREGAEKVKETVMPILDSVVDMLGGWDQLDKTVKDHNPALAEFAKDSFFAKHSPVHGPAKFLLMMLTLGIVQSILPVFAWPLDFVARVLGFLLLYNSGLHLLQAGFLSSSSPPKVKSLLSVFLISSLFQLVPTFAFDISHHLGALWCFFLPATLMITPKKGGPTIVEKICDTLFAQLAEAITSVIPESLQGQGKDSKAHMMIAAGIVGALFWIGYLGGMGAYMAVWVVLAFHTIRAISQPIASKRDDGTAYVAQQTIWHNLLAIWLWRYLFSAVEGLSLPPFFSVIGLILFYLPSYFLWNTALMFGMLMTEKKASSSKASSWYAKWLLGSSKKTAGSKTRT